MSTENTTYALQVAATNDNGFPEEQRGLEPPPTVGFIAWLGLESCQS
jgi:hypothetical protein